MSKIFLIELKKKKKIQCHTDSQIWWEGFFFWIWMLQWQGIDSASYVPAFIYGLF